MCNRSVIVLQQTPREYESEWLVQTSHGKHTECVTGLLEPFAQRDLIGAHAREKVTVVKNMGSLGNDMYVDSCMLFV